MSISYGKGLLTPPGLRALANAIAMPLTDADEQAIRAAAEAYTDVAAALRAMNENLARAVDALGDQFVGAAAVAWFQNMAAMVEGGGVGAAAQAAQAAAAYALQSADGVLSTKLSSILVLSEALAQITYDLVAMAVDPLDAGAAMENIVQQELYAKLFGEAAQQGLRALMKFLGKKLASKLEGMGGRGLIKVLSKLADKVPTGVSHAAADGAAHAAGDLVGDAVVDGAGEGAGHAAASAGEHAGEDAPVRALGQAGKGADHLSATALGADALVDGAQEAAQHIAAEAADKATMDAIVDGADAAAEHLADEATEVAEQDVDDILRRVATESTGDLGGEAVEDELEHLADDEADDAASDVLKESLDQVEEEVQSPAAKLGKALGEGVSTAGQRFSTVRKISARLARESAEQAANQVLMGAGTDLVVQLGMYAHDPSRTFNVSELVSAGEFGVVGGAVGAVLGPVGEELKTLLGGRVEDLAGDLATRLEHAFDPAEGAAGKSGAGAGLGHALGTHLSGSDVLRRLAAGFDRPQQVVAFAKSVGKIVEQRLQSTVDRAAVARLRQAGVTWGLAFTKAWRAETLDEVQAVLGKALAPFVDVLGADGVRALAQDVPDALVRRLSIEQDRTFWEKVGKAAVGIATTSAVGGVHMTVSQVFYDLIFSPDHKVQISGMSVAGAIGLGAAAHGIKEVAGFTKPTVPLPARHSDTDAPSRTSVSDNGSKPAAPPAPAGGPRNGAHRQALPVTRRPVEIDEGLLAQVRVRLAKFLNGQRQVPTHLHTVDDQTIVDTVHRSLQAGRPLRTENQLIEDVVHRIANPTGEPVLMRGGASSHDGAGHPEAGSSAAVRPPVPDRSAVLPWEQETGSSTALLDRPQQIDRSIAPWEDAPVPPTGGGRAPIPPVAPDRPADAPPPPGRPDGQSWAVRRHGGTNPDGSSHTVLADLLKNMPGAMRAASVTDAHAVATRAGTWLHDGGVLGGSLRQVVEVHVFGRQGAPPLFVDAVRHLVHQQLGADPRFQNGRVEWDFRRGVPPRLTRADQADGARELVTDVGVDPEEVGNGFDPASGPRVGVLLRWSPLRAASDAPALPRPVRVDRSVRDTWDGYAAPLLAEHADEAPPEPARQPLPPVDESAVPDESVWRPQRDAGVDWAARLATRATTAIEAPWSDAVVALGFGHPMRLEAQRAHETVQAGGEVQRWWAEAGDLVAHKTLDPEARPLVQLLAAAELAHPDGGRDSAIALVEAHAPAEHGEVTPESLNDPRLRSLLLVEVRRRAIDADTRANETAISNNTISNKMRAELDKLRRMAPDDIVAAARDMLAGPHRPDNIRTLAEKVVNRILDPTFTGVNGGAAPEREPQAGLAHLAAGTSTAAHAMDGFARPVQAPARVTLTLSRKVLDDWLAQPTRGAEAWSDQLRTFDDAVSKLRSGDVRTGSLAKIEAVRAAAAAWREGYGPNRDPDYAYEVAKIEIHLDEVRKAALASISRAADRLAVAAWSGARIDSLDIHYPDRLNGAARRELTWLLRDSLWSRHLPPNMLVGKIEVRPARDGGLTASVGLRPAREALPGPVTLRVEHLPSPTEAGVELDSVAVAADHVARTIRDGGDPAARPPVVQVPPGRPIAEVQHAFVAHLVAGLGEPRRLSADDFQVTTTADGHLVLDMHRSQPPAADGFRFGVDGGDAVADWLAFSLGPAGPKDSWDMITGRLAVWQVGSRLRPTDLAGNRREIGGVLAAIHDWRLASGVRPGDRPDVDALANALHRQLTDIARVEDGARQVTGAVDRMLALDEGLLPAGERPTLAHLPEGARRIAWRIGRDHVDDLVAESLRRTEILRDWSTLSARGVATPRSSELRAIDDVVAELKAGAGTLGHPAVEELLARLDDRIRAWVTVPRNHVSVRTAQVDELRVYVGALRDDIKAARQVLADFAPHAGADEPPGALPTESAHQDAPIHATRSPQLDTSATKSHVDAPATDAPATDARATDARATDARATDALPADAPATDSPTEMHATESPVDMHAAEPATDSAQPARWASMPAAGYDLIEQARHRHPTVDRPPDASALRTRLVELLGDHAKSAEEVARVYTDEFVRDNFAGLLDQPHVATIDGRRVTVRLQSIGMPDGRRLSTTEWADTIADTAEQAGADHSVTGHVAAVSASAATPYVAVQVEGRGLLGTHDTVDHAVAKTTHTSTTKVGRSDGAARTMAHDVAFEVAVRPEATHDWFTWHNDHLDTKLAQVVVSDVRLAWLRSGTADPGPSVEIGYPSVRGLTGAARAAAEAKVKQAIDAVQWGRFAGLPLAYSKILRALGTPKKDETDPGTLSDWLHELAGPTPWVARSLLGGRPQRKTFTIGGHRTEVLVSLTAKASQADHHASSEALARGIRTVDESDVDGVSYDLDGKASGDQGVSISVQSGSVLSELIGGTAGVKVSFDDLTSKHRDNLTEVQQRLAEQFRGELVEHNIEMEFNVRIGNHESIRVPTNGLLWLADRPARAEVAGPVVEPTAIARHEVPDQIHKSVMWGGTRGAGDSVVRSRVIGPVLANMPHEWLARTNLAEIEQRLDKFVHDRVGEIVNGSAERLTPDDIGARFSLAKDGTGPFIDLRAHLDRNAGEYAGLAEGEHLSGGLTLTHTSQAGQGRGHTAAAELSLKGNAGPVGLTGTLGSTFEKNLSRDVSDTFSLEVPFGNRPVHDYTFPVTLEVAYRDTDRSAPQWRSVDDLGGDRGTAAPEGDVRVTLAIPARPGVRVRPESPAEPDTSTPWRDAPVESMSEDQHGGLPGSFEVESLKPIGGAREAVLDLLGHAPNHDGLLLTYAKKLLVGERVEVDEQPLAALQREGPRASRLPLAAGTGDRIRLIAAQDAHGVVGRRTADAEVELRTALHNPRIMNRDDSHTFRRRYVARNTVAGTAKRSVTTKLEIEADVAKTLTDHLSVGGKADASIAYEQGKQGSAKRVVETTVTEETTEPAYLVAYDAIHRAGAVVHRGVADPLNIGHGDRVTTKAKIKSDSMAAHVWVPLSALHTVDLPEAELRLLTDEHRADYLARRAGAGRPDVEPPAPERVGVEVGTVNLHQVAVGADLARGVGKRLHGWLDSTAIDAEHKAQLRQQIDRMVHEDIALPDAAGGFRWRVQDMLHGGLPLRQERIDGGSGKTELMVVLKGVLTGGQGHGAAPGFSSTTERVVTEESEEGHVGELRTHAALDGSASVSTAGDKTNDKIGDKITDKVDDKLNDKLGDKLKPELAVGATAHRDVERSADSKRTFTEHRSGPAQNFSYDLGVEIEVYPWVHGAPVVRALTGHEVKGKFDAGVVHLPDAVRATVLDTELSRPEPVASSQEGVRARWARVGVAAGIDDGALFEPRPFAARGLHEAVDVLAEGRAGAGNRWQLNATRAMTLRQSFLATKLDEMLRDGLRPGGITVPVGGASIESVRVEFDLSNVRLLPESGGGADHTFDAKGDTTDTTKLSGDAEAGVNDDTKLTADGEHEHESPTKAPSTSVTTKDGRFQIRATLSTTLTPHYRAHHVDPALDRPHVVDDDGEVTITVDEATARKLGVDPALSKSLPELAKLTVPDRIGWLKEDVRQAHAVVRKHPRRDQMWTDADDILARHTLADDVRPVARVLAAAELARHDGDADVAHMLVETLAERPPTPHETPAEPPREPAVEAPHETAPHETAPHETAPHEESGEAFQLHADDHSAAVGDGRVTVERLANENFRSLLGAEFRERAIHMEAVAWEDESKVSDQVKRDLGALREMSDDEVADAARNVLAHATPPDNMRMLAEKTITHLLDPNFRGLVGRGPDEVLEWMQLHFAEVRDSEGAARFLDAVANAHVLGSDRLTIFGQYRVLQGQHPPVAGMPRPLEEAELLMSIMEMNMELGNMLTYTDVLGVVFARNRVRANVQQVHALNDRYLDNFDRLTEAYLNMVLALNHQDYEPFESSERPTVEVGDAGVTPHQELDIFELVARTTGLTTFRQVYVYAATRLGRILTAAQLRVLRSHYDQWLLRRDNPRGPSIILRDAGRRLLGIDYTRPFGTEATGDGETGMNPLQEAELFRRLQELGSRENRQIHYGDVFTVLHGSFTRPRVTRAELDALSHRYQAWERSTFTLTQRPAPTMARQVRPPAPDTSGRRDPAPGPSRRDPAPVPGPSRHDPAPTRSNRDSASPPRPRPEPSAARSPEPVVQATVGHDGTPLFGWAPAHRPPPGGWRDPFPPPHIVAAVRQFVDSRRGSVRLTTVGDVTGELGRLGHRVTDEQVRQLSNDHLAQPGRTGAPAPAPAPARSHVPVAQAPAPVAPVSPVDPSRPVWADPAEFAHAPQFGPTATERGMITQADNQVHLTTSAGAVTFDFRHHGRDARDVLRYLVRHVGEWVAEDRLLHEMRSDSHTQLQIVLGALRKKFGDAAAIHTETAGNRVFRRLRIRGSHAVVDRPFPGTDHTLRFDNGTMAVTVNGRHWVELDAVRFLMLERLTRNPGQLVLTSELNRIFGSNQVPRGIGRLYTDLEDPALGSVFRLVPENGQEVTPEGRILTTIIGYRLVPTEAEQAQRPPAAQPLVLRPPAPAPHSAPGPRGPVPPLVLRPPASHSAPGPRGPVPPLVLRPPAAQRPPAVAHPPAPPQHAQPAHPPAPQPSTSAAPHATPQAAVPPPPWTAPAGFRPNEAQFAATAADRAAIRVSGDDATFTLAPNHNIQVSFLGHDAPARRFINFILANPGAWVPDDVLGRLSGMDAKAVSNLVRLLREKIGPSFFHTQVANGRTWRMFRVPGVHTIVDRMLPGTGDQVRFHAGRLTIRVNDGPEVDLGPARFYALERLTRNPNEVVPLDELRRILGVSDIKRYMKKFLEDLAKSQLAPFFRLRLEYVLDTNGVATTAIDGYRVVWPPSNQGGNQASGSGQ